MLPFRITSSLCSYASQIGPVRVLSKDVTYQIRRVLTNKATFLVDNQSINHDAGLCFILSKSTTFSTCTGSRHLQTLREMAEQPAGAGDAAPQAQRGWTCIVCEEESTVEEPRVPGFIQGSAYYCAGCILRFFERKRLLLVWPRSPKS